LTGKNKTLDKFKKFPLIFLDYDFEEFREKGKRTTELTIFIFDKTKESYLMKTRNVSTFPKLRTIEEKFLQGLKISHDIFKVGDYNHKELPYRLNNLNSIVDAIQINLNEIIFKNC
jgi:hypothetical protein